MVNSKAVLMPKRHFLAISALILLALVSGCAPGETASNGPFITAVDGSAIEDFYFVYETGRLQDFDFLYGTGRLPNFFEGYFLVMLDTKNNIIGGWGRTESEREPGNYYSKYCHLDYHMPLDRLQELYADIIKYDIKSYSGPDVLIDETVGSAGDYARITFRINGEVFSVTANDSVCTTRVVGEPGGPVTMTHSTDEFDNLCTFCSIVINKYIMDNDAYRSFKASDCVC